MRRNDEPRSNAGMRSYGALYKKTIGFIGGGNLAEALIKGLIASGASSPANIVVSDRAAKRLVHIAETCEVKVLIENFEAARIADIIFIAVKPKDAAGALKDIAPELNAGKLLISAAAGVTTNAITQWLTSGGTNNFRQGMHPPVIRAMPNTPVIVREGMTALYAGEYAKKEHLKLAKTLFEAVGRVIVLEDESLMDAVTGLSGSGPAYIFLIMEALMNAGVKLGVPEKDAKTLALQTTLGAAKLAQESPQTFAELRRMVASPGGTTAQGLKKLEEGRLGELLTAAVEAAATRATEISREVSEPPSSAKKRG